MTRAAMAASAEFTWSNAALQYEALPFLRGLFSFRALRVSLRASWWGFLRGLLELLKVYNEGVFRFFWGALLEAFDRAFLKSSFKRFLEGFP